MAKLKMHYSDGYSSTVCGTYPAQGQVTTSVRRVTCGHCKRSPIYIADGGTPLPKKPKVEKPKPEKPTFEVTPEVVVAFRVLGKMAAGYAIRANVCNEYDRFVEYLNKQIPEGVVIPGRLTTYVVKVAKKSGEEFITMDKKAINRATAISYAQNDFGYDLRKVLTFTVIEEKD